jgi:CcmD family protein
MTWVFAAFAAVWLAVFLFLVRIARTQRTLGAEIAAIKSSKR